MGGANDAKPLLLVVVKVAAALPDPAVEEGNTLLTVTGAVLPISADVLLQQATCGKEPLPSLYSMTLGLSLA